MEASGNEDEISLAKIARELRSEFCWLANIGDDGTIPDPTAVEQRAKRNLVRSVFSFVEAISFAMKANGLKRIEEWGIEWDDAEKLLAQEMVADLTDAGQTVRRKAKLRSMSNVRFAFRFLSEVYGAGFVLNVGSNGWDCLQRANKVRDRLTHPKRLSDLQVSSEEYSDSLRAFIWFERQTILLMEARSRALEEMLRQSEQTLRSLGNGSRSRTPEEVMPPRPVGLDDDV